MATVTAYVMGPNHVIFRVVDIPTTGPDTFVDLAGTDANGVPFDLTKGRIVTIPGPFGMQIVGNMLPTMMVLGNDSPGKGLYTHAAVVLIGSGGAPQLSCQVSLVSGGDPGDLCQMLVSVMKLFSPQE